MRVGEFYMFPRWLSDKEFAYQGKRHKRYEFSPWVG